MCLRGWTSSPRLREAGIDIRRHKASVELRADFMCSRLDVQKGGMLASGLSALADVPPLLKEQGCTVSASSLPRQLRKSYISNANEENWERVLNEYSGEVCLFPSNFSLRTQN